MADYLDNLDPANLINVVKQLMQDVAELKLKMINVNNLAEISPDSGDI